MGKLTVLALRAVLVVLLAGSVFVQAVMVWALVSGTDPEDGALPLTPLRVITILGWWRPRSSWSACGGW